MQHDSFN